MKEIQKINKNNFLKKIFIKLCRFLGYEIIDQSNFYVPTQKKALDENLSIAGKKSITIPLGEVNISRKVSGLTVIFRSCTSVNMLTQTKKRLFDKNKSEYTLRSLYSILKALKICKNNFPNINLNIIIIDHNSEKDDLDKMKFLLKKSNLESSIIALNVNEFINKINKTNSENNKVTNNQLSNMSNIYKSLMVAKNNCEDLIYFVEDDYIHQKESINEMLYTYEKIASIIKKELILCPIDYPYLYNKTEKTNIFLGGSRHWRMIEETLCTFLTSKKMIIDYWRNLHPCVNLNIILLNYLCTKYTKKNIAYLQFPLWLCIALISIQHMVYHQTWTGKNYGKKMLIIETLPYSIKQPLII